MMRTIGESLRAIRESTGLSQGKLGKKLEITRATVQRCERADANPAWATILRYLGGCEATPYDLALEIAGAQGNVVIANGDEAMRGKIEPTEARDGVHLRMAGKIVARASNSRELLERLPRDITVYGQIR